MVLLAGTVRSAVAAEPALLRFAHLSPDTPAVDVALTPVPHGGGPVTDPGPDVATGLGYGDLDEFRSLAPGSYAVSVRPAGSSPDTPPAMSELVDLAAGTAATVSLSGLFADLRLAVLPDDLSAPPPASARVRVLPATADGAPIGATVRTGPASTEALPLPEAGDTGAGDYVAVPAGPASLTVAGASGEVRVDLGAGSVVSIVVLDAPGGGRQVRPVVDAVGPAVVPAGGVDAGAGPAEVPLPALLGGLALLGLGVVRRSRGPLLVVAAAATALVPVGAPAATTTPPPVLPVSLAAQVQTAVAPPERLRIPAAGIDAPLGPVALDSSGALSAPDDPSTAGWFADSPAPGARGPSVLAGHVDWAGTPGVFADLDAVGPGDEVAVERADGTVARFTVTRVERVAKSAFPTEAVYAPTSGAELRLVTCGGAFDRSAGSYADNVVVFAVAG